ncbi:hypothetical protein KY284_007730 [Solanum tuberosum]|nr:hypothetical protein KY284_007730 [Solanum tuberosum]
MLHYKLYTAGYRLLHYNSPANRGLLRYKLYTAGYRLLHYNSPASRGLLHYNITQPDTGFYITTAPPAGGITLQPDTGFYITTAPPVEGFYITSFTQPDTGFTLQQPRQPEALHYKLYTARCRLLHYNSPASRGPLHYKTKHYNEELPLSSKLGQVSAMSSITSYVKDSLSKLNSTRFSEVQV